MQASTAAMQASERATFATNAGLRATAAMVGLASAFCVMSDDASATSAAVYAPLMGLYCPRRILRMSAPSFCASNGYRPMQHSYCSRGTQAGEQTVSLGKEAGKGVSLGMEAKYDI